MILVGLAAVAIGCVLTRSGCELDKHLALNDNVAQVVALAESGTGQVRCRGLKARRMR